MITSAVMESQDSIREMEDDLDVPMKVEEPQPQKISLLGAAQLDMKALLADTAKQSQNIITEDGDVDYEIEIKFDSYETKIIDLSVMCETDADSLNTHLAEVPKSTLLSIDRSRLDE